MAFKVSYIIKIVFNLSIGYFVVIRHLNYKCPWNKNRPVSEYLTPKTFVSLSIRKFPFFLYNF